MRVILADNQTKVRFALRVLLERQLGLEIVGEAVNAQDLLRQTEAAHPDLILLGWELPGLSADSLLPGLRKLCPALVVIALSGRLGVRQVALSSGVNAFVSKSDPPERLLATIQGCCNQGRNAIPSSRG
jgi:DNA-binding NarL/FixJ family response regulator